MNQRENIINKDNRKSSQGFVDLKAKTVPELEELVKRQNKLLQNRLFLEKLPDKGKKIQLFKTELEIELRKKQEYNTTCHLFESLTFDNKNSESIEWDKGKLNIHHQQLDSDDDDDDDDDDKEASNPLKVIATHSGTATGKIIKVSSFESGDNDIKTSSYVDKVCEKFEKIVQIKERFKPNQFKNNDKTLFITSAKKVKERLGDKWEVTQATPPAIVYQDVLLISLSESLKLQKDQAQKIKEIEKKNTAERLLQNMSVKMGEKLPINNVTEYRNNQNIFYESTESSDENDGNQSDSDNHNEKPVHFVINKVFDIS